jgi:tetratricopeptide (TPR) repeat protein/predicted Ser/Thr protein kinase
MSTGQWRRIEELFNGAVTLQGDARRAFLDEACGADGELRRDVESLLRAADSGGDAAREGVRSAFASYAPPPSRATGHRVGDYVLLREIGHGGMGAVFLAERADDQFRKQVAVKFMRGVPSTDLRRRFKSERQILATLEHPHVARLLDGGVTDSGEPYVVMEYVDGDPIDVYCTRRSLDTRDRLRLFRDVCAAVQAAHRSLIVHRDIKPLNILVTAERTVKLLDFGIAKLLDDPDSGAGTATSERLLTPDYASPEQIRGEAITTGSDIYSLGVLLYKLLTDAKPYRVDAKDPAALARAILQEEPVPPSRATASRLLRRELAGDLDTIVLKAMRKEPAQRYATVEQFSDDITRYLDGRPVLARPMTRGYRLRKFIARHRTEVAGAIGGFVLVVGLTSVYLMRLARERDFALQEQRTAQQVTAFVERVFRISNPSETRGRTITALEVLDSAVARIPKELGTEPKVKAAMLHTLGTVYRNLGREREARQLIEDGLRLRDSLGGRGSPTVGEFLSTLGDLTNSLGQFDSAAVLLRAAVVRLSSEEPAVPIRVLDAQRALGNTLRRVGRLEAADTVLRASVEAARALPSDTGGVLIDLLGVLGALRVDQRRGDEAVPIMKEAWEKSRAKWGEDAPATLANLGNLGEAYQLQGKYAEAEPILLDVLRLMRRVLGDSAPATAVSWGNLAVLYNAQGKSVEAENAARQALALHRRLYGAEHQRVALDIGNLATIIMARGKFVEAEQLQREALAIRERMLSPGHFEISTGYSQLGQVLQMQRKFPQAEQAYRRALDVVTRGAGIDSPDGAVYQANLGSVLLAQGKTTESERVLRSSLATMRRRLPADHFFTSAVLTTLGMLLNQTRRASEAEPLLTESLRIRRAVLDSSHWAIQETRSVYGESLMALGRHAEAEPLLTQSVDAIVKRFGTTDRKSRLALDRVARFYEARGDAARAAEYRRRLATR